jgi:hypothetical protein
VPFAGPGPVLTAGAPVFPLEPVGFISEPQEVLVTNTGDQPLDISGVSIHAEEAASRGEFLLAEDDCSGETIEPGDTCAVIVRYAPGRAEVTSNAALVFKTNTTDGVEEVPLSATSTKQPTVSGPEGPEGPAGAEGKEGKAGSEGKAGAEGKEGKEGKTGPQGPTGAEGKQGAEGAVGQTGPQGAAGQAGAEGPMGPTGAAGVAGAAGKEGPTGKEGSAGKEGKEGKAGPAGATGAVGPKGATGAAGPKGAPGREATVRCEKGKGTKVTCKITYGAKASSAKERKLSGHAAKLLRGGKVYAEGTVGHLLTRRSLAPGEYTMQVKTGSHQVSRFKIHLG